MYMLEFIFYIFIFFCYIGDMGCHWYLPYITNIAPNWPIIGNIFAISTENTNK